MVNRDCSALAAAANVVLCGSSSGDFLTPSPRAEQAIAGRQSSLREALWCESCRAAGLCSFGDQPNVESTFCKKAALAALRRECRSVEALAPVRNAACDREHRADMKIKQPTGRQRHACLHDKDGMPRNNNRAKHDRGAHA